MVQLILSVPQLLGVAKECLRRNAADVNADATKGRLVLYHDGLEATLGCPDRSDVAARTPSDDRDVVLLRALRREAEFAVVE